MRSVCLLVLASILPGCVAVEVGVTNPIDGLSTVAVTPFFNLSSEKTVDGREFAAAYFAELQKVPGFQVLPVGVVEDAIAEHQLELTSPEAALQLARVLGVDAVVVGAVTDYKPYYPPRLGLQVSWYSPKPIAFSPGVPTDPGQRKRWNDTFSGKFSLDELLRGSSRNGTKVVRGQSPPSANDGLKVLNVSHSEEKLTPRDVYVSAAALTPDPVLELEPLDPVMSYTRMFDGTDDELTANLRDYVALNGDRRAGGWEAYLHRTEDFVQFASHLMIVEMLTLHGGDARRRIVFTSRKHR